MLLVSAVTNHRWAGEGSGGERGGILPPPRTCISYLEPYAHILGLFTVVPPGRPTPRSPMEPTVRTVRTHGWCTRAVGKLPSDKKLSSLNYRLQTSAISGGRNFVLLPGSFFCHFASNDAFFPFNLPVFFFFKKHRRPSSPLQEYLFSRIFLPPSSFRTDGDERGVGWRPKKLFSFGGLPPPPPFPS